MGQPVRAESMNRACYYNEAFGLAKGRYEFDLFAFNQKVHLAAIVNLMPQGGQCVTLYPYILETPQVAGKYRTTATATAHMVGESDFKDSNGTIDIK